MAVVFILVGLVVSILLLAYMYCKGMRNELITIAVILIICKLLSQLTTEVFPKVRWIKHILMIPAVLILLGLIFLLIFVGINGIKTFRNQNKGITTKKP